MCILSQSKGDRHRARGSRSRPSPMQWRRGISDSFLPACISDSFLPGARTHKCVCVCVCAGDACSRTTTPPRGQGLRFRVHGLGIRTRCSKVLNLASPNTANAEAVKWILVAREVIFRCMIDHGDLGWKRCRLLCCICGSAISKSAILILFTTRLRM